MILLNKVIGLPIVLALVMFPVAAFAAPTITSPYVSEGEAAVEFKGGYEFGDDDADDDSWETEASVSYGVTSFWETKLAIEAEGAEDEDTEFSKLAFENKFQLAPKGALFIDPGLKIEYARNLEGGPDEIEAKLLLSKPVGDFSNMANFGIAREVGEDSEDDFSYSLSYGLAYAWTEDFQLGVEWYSDFGDFDNDFDEQGHQFGPVAYGDIVEGLEYEAGLLFGVSDAAPDFALKAVLEYEF